MHCEQKEPDTFPSQYTKDYVWHKNPPDFRSFSGFDAFALTKDEKKAFIDLNAIKEIPWDEQLEIIKKLYSQRMKTTYHVSYCEDAKSKLENVEEKTTDDDTLLQVADKLFTKKTQKVLQPIPTSRRVMGYSRPAYYYTGLSEYQDMLSRTGYNKLAPTRDLRLKQRLAFCQQFKL